jgi:hypothetical protein
MDRAARCDPGRGRIGPVSHVAALPREGEPEGPGHAFLAGEAIVCPERQAARILGRLLRRSRRRHALAVVISDTTSVIVEGHFAPTYVYQEVGRMEQIVFSDEVVTSATEARSLMR